MNKITINHGTFQVDERVLDQGTITLGRTSDNDVRVEDNTVSAHHAKIVTVFNASHVEDLGSTNGTYVNGRRIMKHTLHSGDIISLGGYQIVFFSDQGIPKKAPEKTLLMSNTRLKTMISGKEVKHANSRQGKISRKQTPASVTDTAAIRTEQLNTELHDRTTVHILQQNKTPHVSAGGGLHELKHTGHHHAGRRSLYMTLAMTLLVLIALVTVILNA